MRYYILLAGLAACLATQGTSMAAGFAGGTGEPNDPYQIATSTQLLEIGDNRDLLDKHFVLIADIDVNPNAPGCRIFGRALIAPSLVADECGSSFTGASFTGTFDGQGHKIYGMRISTVCYGHDYLGLFGSIGKTGLVCNLRVEDTIVSAWERSAYIGVLAGANAGTILECQSAGDVYYPTQMDDEPVGGFVGGNEGIIARCEVQSRISVDAVFDCLGGLVGDNSGLLLQCHADATITTGSRGEGPIGGLAGHNIGSISQCSVINDLEIDGYGHHGGLVGVNRGSILASCTTGRIHDSGWGFLGGLAGVNYGVVGQSYAASFIRTESWGETPAGFIKRNLGTVTGSFWDRDRSDQSQSAAGIGLTTTQMQIAQTYLDAGWDWVDERSNGTNDVWTLYEEGKEYPLLVWNTEPNYGPDLRGSGTPEDPYQIATTADLGGMNHTDLRAHYVLVTNINLGGTALPGPIVPLVAGRLDGAGHTVSNMNIQNAGHAALLGAVSARAEVANLGVASAEIVSPEDSTYLAILAATNAGYIKNCHTLGYVEGQDAVGGLVAWNKGTISQSYSTASLSGRSFVGGLVAINDATVSHTYTLGSVVGRDFVGGLVALNNETVTQCYAIGEASGYLDVGGLVGANNGGIAQSYYRGNSMSQNNGNGVALDAYQLMKKASFIDWDFGTIWSICENRDHPRFLWEGVNCQN